MGADAVCLGWLGTGRMGAAMAGRLIAAGHQVMVWNRTSSKTAPLAERGAVAVGQIADLAGCEIVFVTVAGPADLEQVVTGDGGLLAGARRPGVIVDCSTVSAQVSAAIRAARGAHAGRLGRVPADPGRGEPRPARR